MKLQIEIPKEYEQDFNTDRFKEFFGRVLADMTGYEGLCGRYEKEIANMLLGAFDKAEIVNDTLSDTEQMVVSWIRKLDLESQDFTLCNDQLKIVFGTLKNKIEQDRKKLWLN